MDHKDTIGWASRYASLVTGFFLYWENRPWVGEMFNIKTNLAQKKIVFQRNSSSILKVDVIRRKQTERGKSSVQSRRRSQLISILFPRKQHNCQTSPAS